MNNQEQFSYSITTLKLIQQDIKRRNYYFEKALKLLDKRAEMDLNYSNELESLIQKVYMEAVNQSMPTQYFYSKIVQYCLEDCKRIKQMGERFKQQSTIMQSFYEKDNPEEKKIMILAQSLSEDMATQRRKIQKLYTRFEKKNRQLQQAKIQYLCAYLSSEQLQKKNELYLQVNNLEESTKPLREEYSTLSRRYNHMVVVNTEHLKGILNKVEAVEGRKVALLKDAVRSYLDIQKKSLDETLENNPFRKAKIDQINEATDLNPHSEEVIELEKSSFLFPVTTEYEFIDSIYSRIEIKKNLEQIILYGQSKDHKKQLSYLISQEEQPPIEITFSPKTRRMIDIFKDAFEGQGEFIEESMFEELRELLKNDEQMRKDFTLCLQKYRIKSKVEMKLPNKEKILKCLNVFLDICSQEYDTYNSKMVMVLSLTYYFVEGGCKRELQELIREHPIWRRIGWWKAALLEGIYEETRMKLKKEEGPITIWDIKAGGVSRREEGEELTHQHICFNQVLHYVQNMTLFHIPQPQVLLYARQNIAMLKFTEKFAKDIIDLCHNPSSIIDP